MEDEQNKNDLNTNSYSYKQVNRTYSDTKGSFTKSIILPLFCGALGSVLVIGLCFGIPNIRNKILSSYTESETDVGNQATSTSSSANLSQVSLVDYSDTAVGVAQKVLPSIVGIKVTYNVNSVFRGQNTTAEAEGSRNYYK